MTAHFSVTHLSTRGFGPKLKAAIHTLNARGMLPVGLRPVELRNRIFAELRAQGYDPSKGEIPSRTTINRSVRVVESSV